MIENQKKIIKRSSNEGEGLRIAHINGRYILLSALITGIFTFFAAVIGNDLGRERANNEAMSQVKNYSTDVTSLEELIDKYNSLSDDNNELKDKNSKLDYSNSNLKEENNSLQTQIETLFDENTSLKNQLSQYSSLEEKNKELQERNNLLEAENNNLQNRLEQYLIEIENGKIEPTAVPTSTPTISTKTSIFELSTFKGYSNWYNRSDKADSYYTDTYGEKYPSAHLGLHSSNNENKFRNNPTYLLDNKYSTCTGHIAWPKAEKNASGSAWIDFYSGKTLIYSSPIITADSRLTEFSFDVSGIEKLTVVLNGNGYFSVYIIYQDFDLIE